MLILYYIFKTVSTLHCWTRWWLSKQCSQAEAIRVTCWTCLKKLLHQVSLRKNSPEPLSGLTVGVWGTPSWVSVRYRAVIGLRFGDCLRPFFAFLPKGGFDLLATYENLIFASLQYTKGSKSCWSKKLLMSFSHPPPISSTYSEERNLKTQTFNWANSQTGLFYRDLQEHFRLKSLRSLS